MVVTVRFRIKAGHEQSFLERVRRQAADSLAREEKCRRFDVAVKLADPAEIFLYEVYDSASDFEAHLKMDHFRRFDDDVRAIIETKIVETWEGPLA